MGFSLTGTIMLREPKGGNAIQATTLCDIPVVCEFPDVFLDELLVYRLIGMWNLRLS